MYSINVYNYPDKSTVVDSYQEAVKKQKNCGKFTNPTFSSMMKQRVKQ